MNRYILPLTYLGPLSYHLHRVNDACIIEQNNYYERHTYANRCEILSSHGIIALSIPVIKPVKGTPIKEIRLSDHGAWQKSPWRSIESAYNSSPFFEYYRDELASIYQKDYNYLIDFNMDL